MPPIAAAAGSASRRRSRSSPRSNSRRASSATTRKKNAIKPLLTHCWRLWDTSPPPSRIVSTVPHTRRYEDGSAFAQIRAATAAASRIAAPPVSVRRNDRRGSSRLRALAVRPVSGATAAVESVIGLTVNASRPRTGVGCVQSPEMADVAHPKAPAPADTEMPTELSSSHLRARVLQLGVLVVVVALAIWLTPGLGSLRHRLDHAAWGWLALAAAAELLSALSYVVAFRYVFCARMAW